ncbi:uncharacterized protein FOMMEDRAFT_157283 [Fomitiporia mediterranea MF3/22]|uniref:uncharacterized protein n=1 Tax=Fomitiporia mediterranea (strain MF3/22) TaxID=694068 RepID=UPI0004408259|nr:uncharacterized protein FOMMEDRAFT_157283 [Fomitiporia mediterranea MF3/22]EJD02088.1 hypothetical protein FOMMEDRAFT_157283 [Fomitiporia mediterranea MF3/22]
MAPALGDVTTAHSTLLTSTSIVTPIIIIISSAAGITGALVIVLLAIYIQRRIMSRRRTRTLAETVPNIVITDTSILPASNVVVDSESALDNVIASFKPIGAEAAPLEAVPPVDISDDYEENAEDDDELFPLPKIPKPKRKPPPIIRTLRPSNQRGSGVSRLGTPNPQNRQMGSTPADSEHNHERVELLVSPGVWWYDFGGEAFSSSESSTLEADGTHGSLADSVSSTESGSSEPVSSRWPVRTSRVRFADTSDDQSYATNSRQIPAHRWRFSEIVSLRDHRSLSSFYETDVAQDVNTPMSVSQSQPVSLGSAPTDEAFDRKILEYCWQISDNSSVKSINQVSSSESVTVQFTTAKKSMSSVKISEAGVGRSFEASHLILTSDSPATETREEIKDRLERLVKSKEPIEHGEQEIRKRERITSKKPVSLPNHRTLPRRTPFSNVTTSTRVNAM